jgi:hypothetical protein
MEKSPTHWKRAASKVTQLSYPAMVKQVKLTRTLNGNTEKGKRHRINVRSPPKDTCSDDDLVLYHCRFRAQRICTCPLQDHTLCTHRFAELPKYIACRPPCPEFYESSSSHLSASATENLHLPILLEPLQRQPSTRPLIHRVSLGRYRGTIARFSFITLPPAFHTRDGWYWDDSIT